MKKPRKFPPLSLNVYVEPAVYEVTGLLDWSKSCNEKEEALLDPLPCPTLPHESKPLLNALVCDIAPARKSRIVLCDIVIPDVTHARQGVLRTKNQLGRLRKEIHIDRKI